MRPQVCSTVLRGVAMTSAFRRGTSTPSARRPYVPTTTRDSGARLLLSPPKKVWASTPSARAASAIAVHCLRRSLTTSTSRPSRARSTTMRDTSAVRTGSSARAFITLAWETTDSPLRVTWGAGRA